MEAIQEQEEVKVDPAFEFEAPKYIDFAEGKDDINDDWFETSALGENLAQDLEGSTEDFGVSVVPTPLSLADIETPHKHNHHNSNSADISTFSINMNPSSSSLVSQTTTKKKRPAQQHTHNTTTYNYERPLKRTKVCTTPASVKAQAARMLEPDTASWKPQLTNPKSPYFATNSRLRGAGIELHEESQVRNMSEAITQQAKRRRLNSFYRKKALYGTNYMPIRSVKPLTVPDDISFATDSRLRGVDAALVPEEHVKREPFILRNEHGATVPQPFSFATDYRVAPSSPSATPRAKPFESFNEMVVKIQRKTPKRFRTLSRRKSLWKLSPVSTPITPSITVPEGFHFHCETRQRPTQVLNREEREALEMATMPKFKALPLDPRVFSENYSGVDRVPKPQVTVPEGFRLATEERAHIRDLTAPKEAEETPQLFRFKARELDTTLFQGPARGIRPPSPKHLTIPESPCLATKIRKLAHVTPVVPKEETFIFKARSVPISTPFIPVFFNPTSTEPQPFALHTEERGQRAASDMRAKIATEKKKEKRAREFKAQPMPVPEPPVEAPRAVKVTAPEPFHLTIEERGATYQQKFHAQIEAEAQEARQKAEFKAAPVVEHIPFKPQQSTKPLTVIDDFVLNSDARSAKRGTFEKKKAEKTQMAEEMRKKQEEEEKIEEIKEIKRMRKMMTHKARPIMLGRPVSVQPSNQPLTEPHTPKLTTRKRAFAHSGRDI